MRSDPPALLPVLRSPLQAALLAVVLLHPDEEYSLTDLARRLDVPLSTVSSEVKRLADADILSVRSVGRNRLVRPNVGNRLVRPLTDLVLAGYGPLVVIGEEFSDMKGVDRVLIFGSWAARYAGQAGTAPADVDVLVIGSPDRQDVYDAAERAEQRLDWPVNPTITSRGRWESADDPLVRQVRSSPTVEAFTAGDTDR
jgi:DNA-binding transcriptional ArsR family regulator